MKILFLIIIGIICLMVFFRNKQKNNFDRTAYISGNNVSQKSTKGSSIRRAINDSYNKSWFFTEEGKFKFPRYKSSTGALVKIKDKTQYNDFWRDFSKEEKKNFTIEDFEFHIDVYIEIEIEEFWDYMRRLKIADLKPYEFLKGNIDDLETIIWEIDEQIEGVPYIYPDSELAKILYSKGLLSEYMFQDAQLKLDYYAHGLSYMNVPQLKKLSQELGLNTSLKKQELIDQILKKESFDFDVIHSPLIKNQKFTEMINKFYNLYLNQIKNEIDEWHPFYIQEVWNEVQGNLSMPDNSELVSKVNNYVENKYWEDRIYMGSI